MSEEESLVEKILKFEPEDEEEARIFNNAIFEVEHVKNIKKIPNPIQGKYGYFDLAKDFCHSVGQFVAFRYHYKSK